MVLTVGIYAKHFRALKPAVFRTETAKGSFAPQAGSTRPSPNWFNTSIGLTAKGFIMSRLFDFLAPKAVKAARYREPVFLIFYRSDILFDIDKDNGQDDFCFQYFLGLTGQPFDLDSVKQYVFRYANHFGYTPSDVGNAYAAWYVANVNAVPDSDEQDLVDLWATWLDGADGPDTLRTATGWDADESNASILDFSAHFLLDVLQLRMLPRS